MKARIIQALSIGVIIATCNEGRSAELLKDNNPEQSTLSLPFYNPQSPDFVKLLNHTIPQSWEAIDPMIDTSLATELFIALSITIGGGTVDTSKLTPKCKNAYFSAKGWVATQGKGTDILGAIKKYAQKTNLSIEQK